MAMRKSKSENYFLAVILFLILFVVASAWMLSPLLTRYITEFQQMTSLKSQGIQAQGCVVQKTDYGNLRRLPELTYEFQTDHGVASGHVQVSEENFNRFIIGHCFDIVYLYGDSEINAPKANVDAYDVQQAWEEVGPFVKSILLGTGAMVILAIVSFLMKSQNQKRTLKPLAS